MYEAVLVYWAADRVRFLCHQLLSWVSISLLFWTAFVGLLQLL